VKKFVLLEEPLSIDSGELTPTMKVKRTFVKEKYNDEIESMYVDE
jgi:long-chain acyl-CoA synthetase